MKKKVMLICVLMMASITLHAQQPQRETNTIVVYFSATGNTRNAAEKIALQYNAALWEIEPVEPYTTADLNWRNKKSRSSIEMNDPEERPAIKQCTNIMPYDTIYLGFPIWWGICPRIINSWIDNNLEQLKTKTLIPFATSGSSGIDDAVEYLRKTYPSLTWQNGLLMNKR